MSDSTIVPHQLLSALTVVPTVAFLRAYGEFPLKELPVIDTFVGEVFVPIKLLFASPILIPELYNPVPPLFYTIRFERTTLLSTAGFAP